MSNAQMILPLNSASQMSIHTSEPNRVIINHQNFVFLTPDAAKSFSSSVRACIAAYSTPRDPIAVLKYSSSISVRHVKKADTSFSPRLLSALVYQRLLLQEASRIHSPFLPRLFRCFETPDTFSFALKKPPNSQSLAQVLGAHSNRRISSVVARKIFCEMLLALSDVHNLGFLLRDATLDAFTLSSAGHIQLDDLSIVKKVMNNTTSSASGARTSLCRSNASELRARHRRTISDVYQTLSLSSHDRSSDSRPEAPSGQVKRPNCRHLRRMSVLSSMTSSSQCDNEDSEMSIMGSTEADQSWDKCHNGKPVPLQGRAKSFVGTRSHMSPEQLNASYAGDVSYGSAADVWMLGITLYIMLVGRHPFETSLQNATRLFRSILKKDIQIPQDVPPEIGQVLQGMLRKDERKRMTIEEIKLSPWLRDIDWEQVRKAASDGTPMTDVVHELIGCGVAGTSCCSDLFSDVCAISDVSRSSEEMTEIESGSTKRVQRKKSGLHRCRPKGETLLGFEYFSASSGDL